VTKIISQADIAPEIASDIIKPSAIAGQNAVRMGAKRNADSGQRQRGRRHAIRARTPETPETRRRITRARQAEHNADAKKRGGAGNLSPRRLADDDTPQACVI